jgi:hypothetical protein
MSKNKILSLLLVSVLVLTFLAGCTPPAAAPSTDNQRAVESIWRFRYPD